MKPVFAIIGGTKVNENSYSYQVSIRNNGFHKCGGSVLNHNWILTAAHCTVKYPLATMMVVLGSNNVMSGGIAVRIKKLIPHPSYIRGLHHDDIGLINLEKSIAFSDTIKPINLPKTNIDDDFNYSVVFTGWGFSEVKKFL